jgi:nucleotide-binding universal stress UspA family protein
MFRRLLVPVDFSEKNQAALNSAVEIAGAGEAGEILLLHVVETIEHIEFDEMSEFYRSLENRASAKLFTIEEEIKGKGLRVRNEVLFGKRAETIVRYAEEKGVDLMVLSSHKVDRDHPALGLGTLSYRIAIVARCPVLLVK